MKSRIAAIMAVLVATLVFLPATASAEEVEITRSYEVTGYEVCMHQGHFAATTVTPWDPYSLICYDLSFPAGVTLYGSLDIQGYCSFKYPGSKAVLAEHNIFGWRCERREKIEV